jgi:hypothetical protein
MIEEFKEDLETLLRRELPVEVAIGFLRFLEAAEFRNRFFHV